MEAQARQQLLDMLPTDMQADFQPYILPDETSDEWLLVKAADRISAYLKCLEEEKMGNRDFAQAKTTIQASLAQSSLPEVQEFMSQFVPSFSLSPDDLSRL